MSWDTARYEARCNGCGAVGVYIHRSDDWGRTEDQWEGFTVEQADDYESQRKRSGPTRPVCRCGSRDIEPGALIPG